MDFEAIKKAAQGYEKDMTKFLRNIVKNPVKAVMRKSILIPLQKRCVGLVLIKWKLIHRGMSWDIWELAIL